MAARRARFAGIRRRMRGAMTFLRRNRLLMPLGVSAAIAAILTSAFLGYYYVQFSRIIEARLHGERDRVIPRVFGRPLTFNTGQTISAAELVTRLNDVGYAERSRVSNPGEFAIDGRTVAFVPRGGAVRGAGGAGLVRRAAGAQGRLEGAARLPNGWRRSSSPAKRPPRSRSIRRC